MGDIASRVTCSIDYSGGNYVLKRVDTGNVKYDSNTEIVLAIGVIGGAGYRHVEGGGTIELDVYEETGTPEVDYFALFFSREQFAFVTQVEGGGKRFQYRSCVVANPPERSFNTKGEVMKKVAIKFLQSGYL